MTAARTSLKRALARTPAGRPPRGLSMLIYHRVGGGSAEERDVGAADFAAQLDVLADHEVVAIDDALDRLDRGDDRHRVVLTFDDGFADIYDHAWPLLSERRLPFTLYLTTGYVGGEMHWEGSTANGSGPALTWDQIGEFVASGLCTLGNHTHTHVPPERLSGQELDRCSEVVAAHVGKPPRHFAYPWGVRVAAAELALRCRFRSAATGEVGRNLPGDDPYRLRRIPVRRSDPIEFFAAKLRGALLPEHAYAAAVATAKRLGVRG